MDLPTPLAVYEVAPGSLIVLQDVDFTPGEMDHLVEEIESIAGHRDFCLIVMPTDATTAVFDATRLLALLHPIIGEILSASTPTGFRTGATLLRPPERIG